MAISCAKPSPSVVLYVTPIIIKSSLVDGEETSVVEVKNSPHNYNNIQKTLSLSNLFCTGQIMQYDQRIWQKVSLACLSHLVRLKML
jgi:hypothetical protein